MAYSLTVANYTFENPPEEYRKLARLSNSPQTAFNRKSTAFYQSDSQDLQLQVEGTLALDPPLGESSDDTSELERLQDLAISGGEVQVDFDPFFSGKAVIEDDPFRQSEGESTYKFTFSVNTESTDDSAYPAHSSPDTGNTFELGSLDLGYDPSEVTQNYERQTEKVKRLQGIARTVDTEGLIPKVTVSGLIDGGGQADLWQKARANTLAYLSAEFQNGWALLDSLSIRNAPEAPDYLTGLFRYDMDLLIVMDPESGIGEVSKYVDQEVKGSTEYVSNCDEDGVFERLGDDTEDYPYALDYRVSGGTGKLNDGYIEWQEDFGTLAQSATNYIWIEDPDSDGYGQVNTGTSGFPGNSVALFEVDTGTSSVNAIRDVRKCLTGTRIKPTDLGDLNFTDDLTVSDGQFSFERLLALSDQMSVQEAIDFWLGILDLTDTISLADGVPSWVASQSLPAESVNLDDGGSAIGGGGGGTTTETTDWGTATDWDNAVSETSVVHESFGDHDSGTVEMGYPSGDPGGSSMLARWDLDLDSGTSVNDQSGNGNGGSVSNGTVNQTGIANTSGVKVASSGYIRSDSSTGLLASGSSFTISFWVKPAITLDGSLVNRRNLMQERGRIYIEYGRDGEGITFRTYDGNQNTTFASLVMNAGTWYHVVFRHDASSNDQTGFVNGTKYGPTFGDWLSLDYPTTFGVGRDLSSHPTEATYDEILILNRAMSDSEIADLYLSGTTSDIVTATKSFPEAVQPNLSDLVYSLNGGTATITAIGSPGTASEETVIQNLGGATFYNLPWNSDHTDFRVKIEMESSDPTASPTISSASLAAETGTSSDSDQNQKTTWEILGATHDRSGNEYEGGGVISRYGG